MLHILIETAIESLKLFPFLFVTYLIMEFLEHKTGDKSKKIIKKSKNFGPLLGSILGVFPQCGFSAAASNLYAGRIISLGTLFAIYLSTSDEMLPIMISEHAPIDIIIKILLIKVVIGIIAGFAIDLILKLLKKNNTSENEIETICEQQHCHCEKGIFKSSLIHSLQILIYIFLISFVLHLIIHFIGEEYISNLLANNALLGPVFSSFIGLIPNCASSVILTQLYLENVISFSTIICGLLVNSGVGLLILFKVNKNLKENIIITVLLYTIAVISGFILELIF